jgi:hypothetical protein
LYLLLFITTAFATIFAISLGKTIEFGEIGSAVLIFGGNLFGILPKPLKGG